MSLEYEFLYPILKLRATLFQKCLFPFSQSFISGESVNCGAPFTSLSKLSVQGQRRREGEKVIAADQIVSTSFSWSETWSLRHLWTKHLLRNLIVEKSGLACRLPKWNPKHKIFLSHSGKPKEFVRQLCKDLEVETHHPFFDERPSSLPMGERFAPLIFEATRQCLVAVIVLSEDFLISKWPMLELVEFVKAKNSHNPHLKLFPLFYKLSPEDLKNESIDKRWKVAWTKNITLAPDQVMPLDDTSRQLNLNLCIEALHEIRGANGLKFENFASEVAYREAIVKEISLLVALDLLDDTSNVIGNERLCKVVGGMFVEDTKEDSNLYGTYKLGLYGMGGLGKTTMCRALCMFFHKHFKG